MKVRALCLFISLVWYAMPHGMNPGVRTAWRRRESESVWDTAEVLCPLTAYNAHALCFGLHQLAGLQAPCVVPATSC